MEPLYIIASFQHCSVGMACKVSVCTFSPHLRQHLVAIVKMLHHQQPLFFFPSPHSPLISSSPSLPDWPGFLSAASLAAVSPLQAAPLRGPGRTPHPPGGSQLPASWVSTTSRLTRSFPHDGVQLPPLHTLTLTPPLCPCEAGA